MCRPPYYVTLELSVFLFDMIVFLNIVLYAFLSPSDWRTLHVGLWQTLLSIHLITCSLLLLAELGYPFLLMERDKSWSLSTSNDNPFLITSNAVVMGPNSNTYTKEISDRLFWKKVSSESRSPVRRHGILVDRFRAGMWCLVVSQQWCIAEARQSTKTGRTRPRWGCWATGPASHGATSMLDYFFCERLDLFFSQWIWVALLVITEATELRFCRSYTAEKWTLVGHLF